MSALTSGVHVSPSASSLCVRVGQLTQPHNSLREDTTTSPAPASAFTKCVQNKVKKVKTRDGKPPKQGHTAGAAEPGHSQLSCFSLWLGFPRGAGGGGVVSKELNHTGPWGPPGRAAFFPTRAVEDSWRGHKTRKDEDRPCAAAWEMYTQRREGVRRWKEVPAIRSP